MSSKVREIVESHGSNPSNLIPILQDVQTNDGYLSENALAEIAGLMDVSESTIYGVATFYTQFKFVKPGEHEIRICQGTACHVRGAESLLDFFKTNLGIQPGETTKDGRFSLERVACLGCCALAPVMVIDGEVYGHLTTAKAEKILTEYKEGKR
ncbi:MAG: NADH dehydrogenase [Candidatus Proteinoplasmatales archaeon SG8-5]|nr:MAG: NADH dehydrogenase [Candidatus Proteinoplasmatales archaeon SG8-5]